MDLLKSLPKRVKIIGKTYSVSVVEKVDDDDSLGEHDMTKQQILLRAVQHFESIRDTAFHEVVHAVDEQMSLNMKEAQVHALATGLLQVLRDNPKFVKFITEKEPKEKETKL